MKHLLFALAMLASLMVYSQKEEEFLSTEKILSGAPDSVFDSPAVFAEYLGREFNNDREVLRGIYAWTAGSISYDVENMYQNNFSDPPGDLINETFRTRKAICQGYSELFNELCHLNGIRSFVVHGYSKQNGSVRDVGHAWVAAKCDGTWYCFDPTWGAGYIMDGRFVMKFTPEYFMVAPADFIASHMPLDPMWQCLDHPYSVPDFYQGERTGEEKGAKYAYNDSIDEYMQLTRLQQYEITLRRIGENRSSNSVIRDYKRFLEQTLENARIQERFEYQKQVVDRLNNAVVHYNSAATLFNRYINFYNRQFRPSIPDNDIRTMIDTCYREIKRSGKLLTEVDPFNKQIEENLDQLSIAIRDLQFNIEKQKEFLQKYLSTSKAYRGSLFRQQY
jgi:hypothetical protein